MENFLNMNNTSCNFRLQWLLVIYILLIMKLLQSSLMVLLGHEYAVRGIDS